MHGLRVYCGVAVLALAAFAILGIVTADDKQTTPDAAPPQPAAEQDSEAPQPRDQDLRHFMRLKLEASGQILEGLAIEDFALIKQGAAKLNKMSGAEKWRVTNDALYRNFSTDFQRTTNDLVEAADAQNLDRAALKWMDATMGCIECHRYSRGIFVATSATPATLQP